MPLIREIKREREGQGGREGETDRDRDEKKVEGKMRKGGSE